VIVLEGRTVRLEQLREEHFDALARAAGDPEIWRLMSADGSQPGVFRAWFDESLAERIAFATHDTATGEIVGSSSFMSFAPEHRRVEIGHTWLVRSHWRTGANVEAKLLMLDHAFGPMGMRRVEFKTDADNERSRRALEALPAQFEGVHRQHMLVRDGENRDSAWYSILDSEWPEVRANLARRLGRA
jgi:RimJ/RimL family protein N-acetyltransferase